MLIEKLTGSSLYEKQQDPEIAELFRQTQLTIAQVNAAADIETPGSLAGRFTTLQDLIGTVDARITDLLSGQVQFQNIWLPNGFQLPVPVHSHELWHAQVLGQTPNDHHPQVHDIFGPDHRGQIPELAIEWSAIAGHAHDGTATRRISHQDMLNVRPEDHHPLVHDLQSHTGLLSEDLVDVDGRTLRVELIALWDRIQTHLNSGVIAGHSMTALDLSGLGAAMMSDLALHTTDAAGHPQVLANAADIQALQSSFLVLAGQIPPINLALANLDGRLIPLEVAMPLKMDTSNFFPMLLGWGGPAAILGGVTPIGTGNFDTLNINTALNVASINVDGIFGPGGSPNFVSQAMIDSLVIQTEITASQPVINAQIISPVVGANWDPASTTLSADIQNLRYVLRKITGEAGWDLDGGNPPQFGMTSAFAGDDLRTFQELAWYRTWFAATEQCAAMVVDSFEDGTGAASLSGSLVIQDHKLSGSGQYQSQGYSYGNTIPELTYFIVHVEGTNLAGVTVDISVDGGANWDSITFADFDKEIAVSGAPGRDVVVQLTLVNATVFSYGVCLGGL